MDLPSSMGRWPVLHTLGFAVSRASEAIAMAVLQAAGPGLKVLDLSGDLGKPTELEAAQKVYDILTVLKALEAAEVRSGWQSAGAWEGVADEGKVSLAWVQDHS
jgi:hypothetical protein